MPDASSLNHSSMTAVEDIFGLYDPPLWLVTARRDDRRGGLIATSVARASIVVELPRVQITIARHHHTWGLIESSGRFALHLLPADHLDAVWRFGLDTGHFADKFAGLDARETPDGNPLYPHAATWMDCRVEQGMDIGDRSLYLAEIVAGDILARVPVLTVATLMRTAPPEHKAELERLYARDQAIDAAAILAWRQRHGAR